MTDSGTIKYQIEGPFDSSYSLALVNREMALALEKLYPGRISLYSTEGPGDFEPDLNYLEQHEIVRTLWQRSKMGKSCEIVLRNLYPPRVCDVKGVVNCMNSYGWEESAFPKKYMDDFNVYLNLLPVMSQYVKKVMIDNGAVIPVEVVGLGADHVIRTVRKTYPGYLGKGFRFLHVSSCFPRKGIDILLKAYISAFTRDDEVSLIIKTFPNIHNTVGSQIASAREKNAKCPTIVLINEDIDDGYLIDIYHRCNCIVAPSRGEGFGMPLAEAMLLGLPVITTGFGGQVDFCTEGTSWLIDYDFAKAQTHMGLFDSVWAEPKADHLAVLMKEVINTPDHAVREKTDLARANILQKYTWEAAAHRLDNAVTEMRKAYLPKQYSAKKINVGWISSWNTKCGIAAYSRNLVAHLDASIFDLKIFSNTTGDLIAPDSDNVIRCWHDSSDKSLSLLRDKILEENVDVVILQYKIEIDFGWFDMEALSNLLSSLREHKIMIFVMLHAVIDIDRGGSCTALDRMLHELSQVDRIFVHTIADMNRLKKSGLVHNVALFPHGVMNWATEAKDIVKRNLGLQGKTIISSYGFLLPQKGIVELIEAFSCVSEEIPGSHLLLANAVYPHPLSEEARSKCHDLIESLGIRNRATMINNFLSDEESLCLLEASDIVVFPYRPTHESSSAAVRWGLLSERPVACTPVSIFEDVLDAVHILPGCTPEKIAEGIVNLLRHPDELNRKLNTQKEWIREHSWQLLGNRLGNIIQHTYNWPDNLSSDAR